jgi:hypothetical protein
MWVAQMCAIQSKCVDKLVAVALNNSSLTGFIQLLVVTNVIVGFLFPGAGQCNISASITSNHIINFKPLSLVRSAGLFGKSIHPDCLLSLLTQVLWVH